MPVIGKSGLEITNFPITISKNAENHIYLKNYYFYCFFLNKKHIFGIVSSRAIDL